MCHVANDVIGLVRSLALSVCDQVEIVDRVVSVIPRKLAPPSLMSCLLHDYI